MNNPLLACSSRPVSGDSAKTRKQKKKNTAKGFFLSSFYFVSRSTTVHVFIVPERLEQANQRTRVQKEKYKKKRENRATKNAKIRFECKGYKDLHVLTAFAISPFMVPESAAAIPNLPLFRMCMATLKPLPTPNMRGKNKWIFQRI